MRFAQSAPFQTWMEDMKAIFATIILEVLDLVVPRVGETVESALSALAAIFFGS